MKPLKLASGLLLFTISLLMLFAACTSTSQQSTSLQVARVVNNPAHKNLSPNFNTHFAQMLQVSPNNLTGWYS